MCEGLEGFEVLAGKGWVEGWAYDLLQYMYFPCALRFNTDVESIVEIARFGSDSSANQALRGATPAMRSFDNIGYNQHAIPTRCRNQMG